MKTLKFLSVLAISAALFTACEKEDVNNKSSQSADSAITVKKINKTEKTVSFGNHDIHYLYNENYYQVDEQGVKNYFANILELPANVVFESLMVEIFTDSNEVEYYYLKANAISANIAYSITSDLQKISGEPIGQLAFAGSTCTCESEECSWSGCEVTSSPGNGCSCSTCDGKCKKTHTVTSDFTPSMFE